MSVNYDSTAVGVPFIRISNITMQNPPASLPILTISQSNAVKLADGSIVDVGPASSFTFTIDMINNASSSIPLIDINSGASIGSSTTLGAALLSIIAMIRQQQLLNNI